jgi:hypothetical protein
MTVSDNDGRTGGPEQRMASKLCLPHIINMSRLVNEVNDACEEVDIKVLRADEAWDHNDEYVGIHLVLGKETGGHERPEVVVNVRKDGECGKTPEQQRRCTDVGGSAAVCGRDQSG